MPFLSQLALGVHPPLTEQAPQTLHAADPALTRVPVYATRSVRITHAHSHTHAVSLCFAPSSDPKSRAVFSAQCPVSWSLGCQPDANLLAPEVTAPPPRPPPDGLGPSLGGPGSCSAGFCPGCALTITVITVPCLAPCPSGNLQPVTSIVPLPFLGRGRQGRGPRGVGGSPQVSRALPVRPQAVCWGGWGVTGRDLGRCSLQPEGAGWDSSLELCCPGSGGQADPDVSIWGPLLAPLSLAGQRVGPRHSCGWEPMLEANGAAAAADATADAARPLHTHLPLPPPPASERAGGGPRAAAGRAAWGDGGQGRHSDQWGLAGGGGRVEAGRDAAATAVMWGVRGAGRMAGGRGT